MNLALKIIVCFIVFILGIGVGARFFFAPVPTAAEFGITLEGALALNQVRGDIGGVFVGLAIVAVLGLVRREPRYFEAVAICMLGVMTARVVGFIAGGEIHAQNVTAAVAELIFAGVLWHSARKLSESGASDVPGHGAGG
jgi:hypothetical protein